MSTAIAIIILLKKSPYYMHVIIGFSSFLFLNNKSGVIYNKNCK
jgi:hypothetical protein